MKPDVGTSLAVWSVMINQTLLTALLNVSIWLILCRRLVCTLVCLRRHQTWMLGRSWPFLWTWIQVARQNRILPAVMHLCVSLLRFMQQKAFSTFASCITSACIPFCWYAQPCRWPTLFLNFIFYPVLAVWLWRLLLLRSKESAWNLYQLHHNIAA